jgi:capsular exopolysaccharide synthesis family protein
MIQTLGLAQSPQKTEIEPPLQSASKVAGGNLNAAEAERVGSPRKTLRIHTMAFAQEPRESEITPPPQAVGNIAEGFESPADLERVTPPGRNSVIQTLEFANNHEGTEVEPPSQAPISFSEAIENAAERERVTTPAESSMTQTLGLAPNPHKKEIEPPTQAVSEVASGIENATDLVRVAPPAVNSMIQTLDHSQDHKETEIAALPHAVSRVAEGIENATELERIPVEEVDAEPLSRIVYYTDPGGLAADRFRFLRMRIRERSNATKLKSILVTSPLSLDGKSTVSLNLATALAEQGQNAVLLLEADLYHPTLAQRLGLKAGSGLAECLASGVAPLSVIRRVAPLGWYLLPAGSRLANPGELLHGDELPNIIRALSPHFRWIVIDSPPVVPIADTLALARHADASLLVVRAGRTPSEAVEAAIESLGAKHVMGVVLNGVEGLNRLYSKYNRYYGSSADPKIAREPSGAAE